MRDGRMARSIVSQRPLKVGDESLRALAAGSVLLLLALLFGSLG